MSKSNPNIVTFYSFKGGVGRTFCLANVATAMTRWGYRVLCVDWDLEAPGLHHYFQIEGPSHGMIDLILGKKKWKEVVYKNNDKFPRLDLIASGDGSKTYMEKVGSANLQDLYERGGLAEKIELWREEWSYNYDFVLIDSRTGLSDLGAICTAHLPDIVVCSFIANYQNISGTSRIIESARTARQQIPYDRNSLWFVPILSRFEIQEEYERATEWRSRAFEAFAPIVEEWIQPGVKSEDVMALLTLPYVPYWSFGEHLPVIEEQFAAPESLRFRLEGIGGLLSRGLSNSKFFVENPRQYVESARKATESNYNNLSIVASRTSGDFAAKLLRILKPLGFNIDLCFVDKGVDDKRSKQALYIYDGVNDEQLSRLAISTLSKSLESGRDFNILPLLFSKKTDLSSLPSLLQHSALIVKTDTDDEELSKLLYARLDVNAKGANNTIPIKRERDLSVATRLLNSNKRSQIIVGLNQLAEKGVPKHLPLILKFFGDKQKSVREAAFYAFEKLSSNLDMGVILSVLRDAIDSKNTTQEVISGLKIMRIINTDNPAAFSMVLDKLTSEVPEIVGHALITLSKLSPTKSIEWITPFLNDDSDELKRLAGAAAIQTNEEFLILQVARIWSSDHYIQWGGEKSGKEEIRAALKALSGDQIRIIHQNFAAEPELAAVLSMIDSKENENFLVSQLTIKEDTAVVALKTLNSIGPESLIDIIDSTFRSSFQKLRALAYNLASNIKPKVLFDGLKDPSSVVREAAVNAIKRSPSDIFVQDLELLLRSKKTSPSLISSIFKTLCAIEGENSSNVLRRYALSTKSQNLRAIAELILRRDDELLLKLESIFSAMDNHMMLSLASLFKTKKLPCEIEGYLIKIAKSANLPKDRIAAMGSLLESKDLSENDRHLFVNDKYRGGDLIDPKFPIDQNFLKQKASELKISYEEAVSYIKSINASLGHILVLEDNLSSEEVNKEPSSKT